MASLMSPNTKAKHGRSFYVLLNEANDVATSFPVLLLLRAY